MDDRRYRWQAIPPEAPREVLDALGDPRADRPDDEAEPVCVVRAGEPVAWPHRGELVLEDGSRRTVEHQLPADLPLGYHDFYPDHGRWTTRVIVAPGQCPLPPARRWGWAAQLYGVRSAESWGIGDLADLGRLAAWSAGLGAGLVMVNPLAAVAPVVPQADSPYYPTTRRFRNPLYLRIEDVPGAERLGPELARLAAAGHALNGQRRIDRTEVFRLKDQALRAIWQGFQGANAFDDFCRQQGAALEQFAAYCVLAREFGEDWRVWPEAYRRPDSAAVKELAEANRRDVRYHQWLQWLLDRQLARAGRDVAIVQDLPIGMSLGGADAWAWQDLLAKDIAVGAPPDAFNVAGQNWQLPPFVPWKLRRGRLSSRSSRRSGQRCVTRPACGSTTSWGCSACTGYPRAIRPRMAYTFAIRPTICWASWPWRAIGRGRSWWARTWGTSSRASASDWPGGGVLSFRVFWFEQQPPEYPALSMAAVTTHDLPTIAGLWSGSDLAAQSAMGLPKNNELIEVRERYRRTLGLPDAATLPAVIEATHALLSQSPSMLLSATLEDVLGVHERPNMPGTIDQWPNWSLALPGGLEALETSETARRIASVLHAAMTAPHPLEQDHHVLP